MDDRSSMMLDTSSVKNSILHNDETSSEDERISNRSHADSITKSSMSSNSPVESQDQKESEAIKHHRNVSADSEMSSVWTEEKEKTVRGPYDYVVSLGGKAFRRKFLFALNVWLQVDEKSCEIIDEAVSMLHNSSLLIDDIEDDSKHRRGSLSAHEVYGVAQTINAANYVYFEAQERLRGLENWPEACSVFIEELMNLHRGQGMDLYWRDTLQPPSEADYLQMIANKTGGLFRLILRLLQSASDKSICEIEELVEVLGLMFQILDDYKNLKDDKMNAEKGYCEDLTEGKFSYPVSHAMWVNDTKKGELLRILKSKPTDNDIKAYAVQCLEDSGSLEYTREAVVKLHARATSLLEKIPQRNPAIEKMVEELMLSLNKLSR